MRLGAFIKQFMYADRSVMYVTRNTFSMEELLSDLPEEMAKAKEQLKNSQCFGLFFTNSTGRLRCKLQEPNNPPMYFEWNANEKEWNHIE